MNFGDTYYWSNGFWRDAACGAAASTVGLAGRLPATTTAGRPSRFRSA